VGRSISLFAGPALAYGTATDGATTTRTYGFGADAGLRLFFGGRAPEGGWFSPIGALFYATARSTAGERLTATGSMIGALAGYTWIWNSGFVLSLGGGLVYVDLRLDGPGISAGAQGIVPALRLALGYGF
jgi:hypothetical protein